MESRASHTVDQSHRQQYRLTLQSVGHAKECA